jgi:hypothetical protein
MGPDLVECVAAGYYGSGTTCSACKTCDAQATQTGSCAQGSTEDGISCVCNEGGQARIFSCFSLKLPQQRIVQNFVFFIGGKRKCICSSSRVLRRRGYLHSVHELRLPSNADWLLPSWKHRRWHHLLVQCGVLGRRGLVHGLRPPHRWARQLRRLGYRLHVPGRVDLGHVCLRVPGRLLWGWCAVHRLP